MRISRYVAVVASFAALAACAACGSATQTAASTSSRPAPPVTRAPPGSSATVAPPPTTVASTSTTAAGGSTAALVSALEAFFAGGCHGGCTPLTERAGAFSVILDQHDPSWARWSVVDPTIGTGYGYAQLSGGSWAVVAGPGSAAVGCSPSPQTVPAQVLADFGATCPTASS